jgi:branched-chain amino acid transport system permease protein
MVVIMVIVGGLRTFTGPIVGAAFVELLSELLRAWGEVRMVLFALLVIVVARSYPAGLVGLCQAAARGLARHIPVLRPLLAQQTRGQ